MRFLTNLKVLILLLTFQTNYCLSYWLLMYYAEWWL